MKPIVSERLGDLLLARLSGPVNRPPRPGDVCKSWYAFVARELSSGKSQADQTRLGILGKALELVGQIPSSKALGRRACP